MKNKFFNSSDELKEAFGIVNSPEHEKYTPFKDCKVGFSIQKQYPSDIRYKPPKRKDGTPDGVALIKIVYTHPTEKDKPIDTSQVPLSIDVSVHSRYLVNHFAYDFDNEKSPTEQSVLLSRKTPKPISINFEGMYFYDHNKKSFLNKRLEKVSGRRILEEVFQKHCNTIHLFKGLKLRMKIVSQSLGLSICWTIIQMCIGILKIVFGRNLKSKEYMVGVIEEFDRKDIELSNSDKIKVFGYEASKNIIITFSITVLATYTIAYFLGDKSQYVTGITSSPLLALCGALVVLWILDHLIPVLLFKVVNLLIRIRIGIGFMKIKA